MSIRPVTMSDKTDGPGNDTSILTKTKSKTQRPPLYKVLLLNDDYTPMEFVVHVLERFFGLNHAQAFEIMLTVHKKGLAVVDVGATNRITHARGTCLLSKCRILPTNELLRNRRAIIFRVRGAPQQRPPAAMI